jgi:histone deacetylase 6
LHRYDKGEFYPSGEAGHYNKIGEGKGKFYNINIPFNTKEDKVIADAEYLYICKNFLFPIIKEYSPELIFISCGFDSAKGGKL